MKPIRRVDSETPLAPLKDVKLKELPKQAVIDPTLTPEQLKQYKALLSRQKFQRSLEKTMNGIQREYSRDLSEGEKLSEAELEAESEAFSQTLATHQKKQAKLRNELYAKHGMEKDLYNPPEDDGNHIIVRDNSIKNPDLQHEVVPTNHPWARSPRVNLPKK